MNQKAIITMCSIITCLLIGLQIMVSHRLSTAGIQLTQMSNEIDELSHQNEILKHHIASASSMMTISDVAGRNGFRVTDIKYLQHQPLALQTTH